MTVRTSWTKEEPFHTSCSLPTRSSWHLDLPMACSDVSSSQVMLTQVSKHEPSKTILSIISWKKPAPCRGQHWPLREKLWSTSVNKNKKMSKGLPISFLFMAKQEEPKLQTLKIWINGYNSGWGQKNATVWNVLWLYFLNANTCIV